MFVAHDVLLDVSFGVARPRLVGLTSDRALVDASRAAYQEGLASQAREPANGSGVGSFGQIRVMPGAGPGIQLARVRVLAPVERRDSTTIGLRWETTGLTAGLFPILDADITLAAAGEHSTTLTLSGVYRTPCHQPSPAPLAAPVAPGAGTPVAPPAEPIAPPGLAADVAVRALLRHAAHYLTGSGGLIG
jgi:hypothetical protein